MTIIVLAIGWFAGLRDVLTLENMVGAKDQVAGWIRGNAVLLFIAWVLLYATATATRKKPPLALRAPPCGRWAPPPGLVSTWIGSRH